VASKRLLEFLIPAYKRPDGVRLAAGSIATQILEFGLEEEVSIRIVDDASPNSSTSQIVESLNELVERVEVSKNVFNKGMSKNIFDMVSSSRAEFCTVLTDDDWLQPECLPEIVQVLKELHTRYEVGGLFTPRYSYLEDGSLHCVACRPFLGDRVVKASPLNAVRYCEHGFILTGFIFRARLMAKPAWQASIENAYFPIINFGIMLLENDVLFLNRNWFHHTVLNKCHWESWGADESAQRSRLFRDYLKAVRIVRQNALQLDSGFIFCLLSCLAEAERIARRLISRPLLVNERLKDVPHKVKISTAFRVALFILPFGAARSFGFKISRRVLRSVNSFLARRLLAKNARAAKNAQRNKKALPVLVARSDGVPEIREKTRGILF